MLELTVSREVRARQLTELLEDFHHRHRILRASRSLLGTHRRPSDDYSELDAAVVAIRSSAWFTHLPIASDVNSAIEHLKNQYVKTVAASQVPQVTDSETRSTESDASLVKRDMQAQLLENEWWFRRLYAQVISTDAPSSPTPSLKELQKARTKFEKAAYTLKIEAEDLCGKDRELLAALPHEDRRFIEGLGDRLESIRVTVEEARNRIEQPETDLNGKIITKRLSKGPRAGRSQHEKCFVDGREIVRSLVQVCLKTFLWCDTPTMKKLVGYPQSSAMHLRAKALDQLIADTAERKIVNAANWRIDEKDMLEIESKHVLPIGTVIQHGWSYPTNIEEICNL